MEARYHHSGDRYRMRLFAKCKIVSRNATTAEKITTFSRLPRNVWDVIEERDASDAT